MDSTPKPSGYRNSWSGSEDDDRQVQSPKPGPPSHFDFAPSTSRIRRDVKSDGKKVDSDVQGFTVIEYPKEGTTGTDFGVKDVINVVKSLDANRYATKKTIAQGMLDIALLTANASQLKYILQVGKQHEFYTLMLTLICISISLQAAIGILFIIVGGLDINRPRDHRAADIINDAILVGVFVISLTNVIISGFGMESSNNPTEFLAYRRDIMLLQGVVFVMLGSTYNINKTQDQQKANVWNNISVVLMLLTVAVNVVISAFEMRDDVHMNTTVKLADGVTMQSSGIR